VQQTTTYSNTGITATKLKRLLGSIISASGVNFRCRQTGEMWMKHHCQVNSINDKSVLLYDASNGKYYLIKLNNIMQFDIDNRFHHYQPHFHYDVLPSQEPE
jgi:hypothetical protein